MCAASQHHAAVCQAEDCSLSQENNPRTFKEVLAIVPEASKKDVAKCHTFIVKALDNVVRSSCPTSRAPRSPWRSAMLRGGVLPASFVVAALCERLLLS